MVCSRDFLKRGSSQVLKSRLSGNCVGYLPVFTLKNSATGEIVKTTDPGRALVTGKWADIGKVKGPVLRGLASRPPYFHNGSARNLAEVVEFYNKRFRIGLSAEEKANLVAFLSAL
jgi:cytochrome c peroxidase